MQLTEASQTLAAGEGDGSGVYGVVFRGRRYDAGYKLSYLKAVITTASEWPEFGEELKTCMKAFDELS
jgi:UTP--glucose-1-phosphate uridylyltransferase